MTKDLLSDAILKTKPFLKEVTRLVEDGIPIKPIHVAIAEIRALQIKPFKLLEGQTHEQNIKDYLVKNASIETVVQAQSNEIRKAAQILVNPEQLSR